MQQKKKRKRTKVDTPVNDEGGKGKDALHQETWATGDISRNRDNQQWGTFFMQKWRAFSM